MKYSRLLMVSAFACSGLAQAAQKQTVEQQEETDFRMECIENAIADELEDDQMKEFVNACVAERIAARQKAQGKKS